MVKIRSLHKIELRVFEMIINPDGPDLPKVAKLLERVELQPGAENEIDDKFWKVWSDAHKGDDLWKSLAVVADVRPTM